MSIIRRFLYKAAADQMRLPGRRSHPRRSCTGRLFGCLLIVILSLLVCGLLALAIKQVQAASPALAVYLLVDNSNSTFDKTDPLFLRIAAVRLIITYLSLDEGQTTHQCGVIFFGSQAEVVVPLTSLQGQAQLPDLFDQIANPPRLGWTDHAAALRLARQQFEVESPAARRIIILLTDGKPEWNPEENPPTQEAYLAQLQTEGQQLTAAGVSLYVVLLTSEATLTDPDIATVWKPLWQELAAGRFYEARQAEDLPAIYGRIISSLRPPVTSEQLTVISERWVEDSGEWVVANEPPPTLSPQPSRTPQPTEDDRMTRWPGDKVAEHHLVTPSPPPPATPSPSHLATPSPPHPVTPSPPHSVTSSPPLWPVLALILLTAAGSGGYLWRRATQPKVTGLLRVLAGPGLVDSDPYVELERLRRSRVTVGQAPADVPLVGATVQVVIRPGYRVGDSWQMLVSGSEQARFNDEPLTGERPLADGAILTLDSHRLRYENLRLHSIQRSIVRHQPPGQPASPLHPLTLSSRR